MPAAAAFLRTTTGSTWLWKILEEAGPVAFEALHHANTDAESNLTLAKARPLIYGYGAAAAGAGAVSIPRGLGTRLINIHDLLAPPIAASHLVDQLASGHA